MWVYISIGLALAACVASFEASVRMFTPEELARYDGRQKRGKRYLAILGEVYDVSKSDAYGDSGYGYFVGKDASRAFFTGKFDGPTQDDLSDLDDEACRAVADWREFYRNHKVYTFKGKLVGRYFDPLGQPTLELEKIDQLVEQDKERALLSMELEKKYPVCNSHWSKVDGSQVWCTNNMIEGKEAVRLVPRSMYDPHKEEQRCVCVELSEASEMDSKFKKFDNCHAKAQRCSFLPA